jgi:hypothetical protein
LVCLFKIFARFFLVPAGKTVHQSSCEANQEVCSTSLLYICVDVLNDFCVGGVGCDLNHERILPWISGQGNRKATNGMRIKKKEARVTTTRASRAIQGSAPPQCKLFLHICRFCSTTILLSFTFVHKLTKQRCQISSTRSRLLSNLSNRLWIV